MARSINENQAGLPSADDLEPYRQLVELQRQIAELALQNKFARMACSELREQAVAELASQPLPRHKQRRTADEDMEPLPVSLTGSNLMSLIMKEQSTC